MLTIKEKIFQYGIFGIPCSLLSTFEILELLDMKWAEFVTNDQIQDLHKSFTTLALVSKSKLIIDSLYQHMNGYNDILNGIEEDNINYNGIKENTLNGDININKEGNILNSIKKSINIQNKENIKIENILKGLTSSYIVRMNTVAWKEYLTSNNFNFTSKEYYFVFDMLIRLNDYILVSDLRNTLNIEPKKMFYIIKKIKSLGYIERIERENKVYVKIVRDSEGNVFKGRKKEKRKSINSEDFLFNEDKDDFKDIKDKYDIKENKENNFNSNKENDFNIKDIKDKNIKNIRKSLRLCLNVPLIMQIKNLIDKSKNGVSSRDVEEKFGIKLKVGLKLLNKIADKMEGSIKTVEEFEGKIKRTKFYNINELNKRKERKRMRILQNKLFYHNHSNNVDKYVDNQDIENNYNIQDNIENNDIDIQDTKNEQEEEGVLDEERLIILKNLLSNKKAILVDKEFLNKVKNILESKYNLDRKTLINCARKGGLNVYKIKIDKNNQRFVIAQKDILENDPSVQRFLKNTLSNFQMQIYKIFVTNNKFTEIDNLYFSYFYRLRIFYDYLQGLRICNFYLNCDFLNEMPIFIFFQLVSFKRPQFLMNLLNEIRNNSLNNNFINNMDNDKENNFINKENNMNNYRNKENIFNVHNNDIKENIFNVLNNEIKEKNKNKNKEKKEKENNLKIILNNLNIPSDKKTISILLLPMKRIFDSQLPIETIKILRLKFEIKVFVNYLNELKKIKKVDFEMNNLFVSNLEFLWDQNQCKGEGVDFIKSGNECHINEGGNEGLDNKGDINKCDKDLENEGENKGFDNKDLENKNNTIINNTTINNTTTKNINNIESDILINYVNFNDRNNFFKKIVNIPFNQFYKETDYIINRDYKDKKKRIFLKGLQTIKKLYPNILNVENEEYLNEELRINFIEIKKKIILGENINFEKINFGDLNLIVKFLVRRKIIYDNQDKLDNLELTSFFRKKINHKFDNLVFLSGHHCDENDCDNEMDRDNIKGENKLENIDMDECDKKYWSIYFNFIYFHLLKFGSCEIKNFSEKIKILEEFELKIFFKVFIEYFELKEIDQNVFVCIRENENTFLQFLNE